MDITREALLARREQLLQNAQTAIRMQHNIEGAIVLLDTLLAEPPNSPKEPDHVDGKSSQPARS